MSKNRIFLNTKTGQFAHAASHPGADWIVPKLDIADNGMIYHLEKRGDIVVKVPVKALGGD